ncbi:MAG: SpoIIE family protein phosphatase [Lachnospiraceae bacterium]|nr:SpoIIE family protein phosphatase [Lachnospiraceae bacterium]
MVSSLTLRIAWNILVILAVFGLISSFIGYWRFTESLTRQYNDSAFRTGETAVSLVNGDRIEEYLEKGPDDEYYQTKNYLDTLLEKQHVTLIYAIAVDTTDYGSFKSVFNSVEEGSGYTPWELGYERYTTNDEYREKYRQIYEEGLTQATVVRQDDLNGKVPHITSMVPINGSDGQVKGIMCVQRPMEELDHGRRAYLRAIAIATLILICVCVVMALVLLTRVFVKPIRYMVEETGRFARENDLSYESRLSHLSSITELQFLADSIDQMEKETVTYMDRLTVATAEKQRITTEFELANNIQTHAMPDIFPVFPNHNDFEVYATMQPAKEIGGDFYDLFMLDEKNVAMVVADVSGKGIPAALFMMISKTVIKNQAGFSKSPAEILEKSNEQLCENNMENMFVTVWLGIVNIATGELTYALAGHERPIIRHNGVWELKDSRAGMPLGTMEGLKYRNESITLSPGDMIFEYTDGVTEAQRVDNEMFETDRLVEALNHSGSIVPKIILERVKADVVSFVGEAEQFDDITMMTFCYRRPERDNTDGTQGDGLADSALISGRADGIGGSALISGRADGLAEGSLEGSAGISTTPDEMQGSTVGGIRTAGSDETAAGVSDGISGTDTSSPDPSMNAGATGESTSSVMRNFEITEVDSGKGKIRSIRQSFTSGYDNIQVAVDMMAALMEPLHPDKKLQAVVNIVIDEMLGNIDNYAYPAGEPGEVEVEGILDVETGDLIIRLVDSGIPFDPTEVVRHYALDDNESDSGSAGSSDVSAVAGTTGSADASAVAGATGNADASGLNGTSGSTEAGAGVGSSDDKISADQAAKEKRIEELANKGLGIFISGTRVDSMEYERKDGKNILTMVKNIKE